MDIFKHTAKKNKKIKRADQILPEVYGTKKMYYLNTIHFLITYNIQKSTNIWILSDPGRVTSQHMNQYTNGRPKVRFVSMTLT